LEGGREEGREGGRRKRFDKERKAGTERAKERYAAVVAFVRFGIESHFQNPSLLSSLPPSHCPPPKTTRGHGGGLAEGGGMAVDWGQGFVRVEGPVPEGGQEQQEEWVSRFYPLKGLVGVSRCL
jgi:hypothetical protein